MSHEELKSRPQKLAADNGRDPNIQTQMRQEIHQMTSRLRDEISELKSMLEPYMEQVPSDGHGKPQQEQPTPAANELAEIGNSIEDAIERIGDLRGRLRL